MTGTDGTKTFKSIKFKLHSNFKVFSESGASMEELFTRLKESILKHTIGVELKESITVSTVSTVFNPPSLQTSFYLTCDCMKYH